MYGLILLAIKLGCLLSVVSAVVFGPPIPHGPFFKGPVAHWGPPLPLPAGPHFRGFSHKFAHKFPLAFGRPSFGQRFGIGHPHHFIKKMMGFAPQLPRPIGHLPPPPGLKPGLIKQHAIPIGPMPSKKRRVIILRRKPGVLAQKKHFLSKMGPGPISRYGYGLMRGDDVQDFYRDGLGPQHMPAWTMFPGMRGRGPVSGGLGVGRTVFRGFGRDNNNGDRNNGFWDNNWNNNNGWGFGNRNNDGLVNNGNNIGNGNGGRGLSRNNRNDWNNNNGRNNNGNNNNNNNGWRRRNGGQLSTMRNNMAEFNKAGNSVDLNRGGMVRNEQGNDNNLRRNRNNGNIRTVGRNRNSNNGNSVGRNNNGFDNIRRNGGMNNNNLNNGRIGSRRNSQSNNNNGNNGGFGRRRNSRNNNNNNNNDNSNNNGNNFGFVSSRSGRNNNVNSGNSGVFVRNRNSRNNNNINGNNGGLGSSRNGRNNNNGKNGNINGFVSSRNGLNNNNNNDNNGNNNGFVSSRISRTNNNNDNNNRQSQNSNNVGFSKSNNGRNNNNNNSNKNGLGNRNSEGFRNSRRNFGKLPLKETVDKPKRTRVSLNNLNGAGLNKGGTLVGKTLDLTGLNNNEPSTAPAKKPSTGKPGDKGKKAASPKLDPRKVDDPRLSSALDNKPRTNKAGSNSKPIDLTKTVVPTIKPGGWNLNSNLGGSVIDFTGTKSAKAPVKVIDPKSPVKVVDPPVPVDVLKVDAGPLNPVKMVPSNSVGVAAEKALATDIGLDMVLDKTSLPGPVTGPVHTHVDVLTKPMVHADPLGSHGKHMAHFDHGGLHAEALAAGADFQLLADAGLGDIGSVDVVTLDSSHFASLEQALQSGQPLTPDVLDMIIGQNASSGLAQDMSAPGTQVIILDGTHMDAIPGAPPGMTVKDLTHPVTKDLKLGHGVPHIPQAESVLKHAHPPHEPVGVVGESVGSIPAADGSDILGIFSVQPGSMDFPNVPKSVSNIPSSISKLMHKGPHPAHTLHR